MISRLFIFFYSWQCRGVHRWAGGRKVIPATCQKFAYLLTSVAVAYSLEYFHAKVLTTIEAWPVEILADYARLVELLMEHGPDLGLPHSRALGGGLFELRPKGRSGIGRALYGFLAGQRVIVLHAFIKKTQQTPDRDLKKARDRMKEVIQNEQAKARAGRT